MLTLDDQDGANLGRRKIAEPKSNHTLLDEVIQTWITSNEVMRFVVLCVLHR